MRENQLILVNERDEMIGTMEKQAVHEKGLLHRAFSVFIFNSSQQMLLHKRASHKYHTPGLWTNACCSHPLPGEDIMEAAHRRLKEELGFDCPLQKLFDFIYQVKLDNGLTEFEFDHVLFGVYDGAIHYNTDEISDYMFIKPLSIQYLLDNHQMYFTPWFRIAFPDVMTFLKKHKMLPEP